MAIFPVPVRLGSPRFLAVAALVGALAAMPIVATLADAPFYLTLGLRVLIFGLAATSLNVILGYGGLVSFGHALYLGIGAYTIAILSYHGVTNGWVHLITTLAISAAVSFLTGLVCLRTSGIAFIMITLAFAQMFYFFATSLKYYGGDEGLTISAPSDFSPLFSIRNNFGLYFFALTILFSAMYLSWRFVYSRLGRVMGGISSNPRRMNAVGFPVVRYQLATYVLSSCFCGIAGLLLGNLARLRHLPTCRGPYQATLS